MNKEHEVSPPRVENDSVGCDTETLEAEHGGTLMRVKDLPPEYEQLKAWVGNMKFGRDNVLAIQRPGRVTIKWYTVDSVISVSARLPQHGDDGYLGGGASMRAPRPGETWTRGNDLADGPYCESTWLAILSDAAGWSALPLAVLTPNKELNRS